MNFKRKDCIIHVPSGYIPGMNEWITFASKELRKQQKYSALRLQKLFICSFKVNTKNWETAHAQVMRTECSLQYLEYLGMKLYPGHVWQSWVRSAPSNI